MFAMVFIPFFTGQTPFAHRFLAVLCGHWRPLRCLHSMPNMTDLGCPSEMCFISSWICNHTNFEHICTCKAWNCTTLNNSHIIECFPEGKPVLFDTEHFIHFQNVEVQTFQRVRNLNLWFVHSVLVKPSNLARSNGCFGFRRHLAKKG